IPLLSAIARLDISSPREQGVRFAHGVAMSSQKNGAAILDKTKAYRPSDKEPFMNERQREYFRQKLLTWKEEILKEAKQTLAHLAGRAEDPPGSAPPPARGAGRGAGGPAPRPPAHADPQDRRGARPPRGRHLRLLRGDRRADFAQTARGAPHRHALGRGAGA